MPALLLLGCSLDDPAPPGPQVALDVVVGELGTDVYLRPTERDCECSSAFFFDGRGGTTFSDAVGCTCDGGRRMIENAELLGCIDDVRGLDRVDGEAVEASAMPGVISFPTEVSELVIRGCGGETRVLLDGLTLPEAVLADDVRRTGPGAADAATDTVDATHAQLCTDSGFEERCCDGAPGRVAIPIDSGGFSATLVLAAVAGPVELEGASGPIRVWRRARRTVGPAVVVPEPDGDQWGIDARRGFGSVAAVTEFRVDRVLFDADAPESITLLGANATVRLGLATDDIDVGEGVHYTATLPHEPISRALPLGDVVSTDIVVAPVPVTLTRRDDPTQTLEGSFEVQARLPAIARP